MASKPCPDLEMLVRSVVVENDVNGFAGRDLRFDGVQEADELLMPVTLHDAADDGAVEHVECGKQGCGAMALVVVGHRSGPPLLHGEAGLGAVKCLDLALLIDGQDNGVSRLVDIETDHIVAICRQTWDRWRA